MKTKSIQIKIKTITKQNTVYSGFIKNLLNKLNVKYAITYLPKKTKRVTLLKSPHVDKKAREQFQLNTYKTVINIFSEKINKALFNFIILNKPKYIKLQIKKLM